jgi:uncharacterized protein YjbI with pentapeptide repeats
MLYQRAADLSHPNQWSFVNLSHATLLSARFPQFTDMTNANLQFANLTGAHLSGEMRNSNLDGSVLKQATITSIVLANASIRNANMQGASITSANLTGADFTDSDTTNVTYLHTICPDGTNSDNNGATCAGHGGGL